MSLIKSKTLSVGFAEENIQIEDDTVCHVEWLSDTSEFPLLSVSKELIQSHHQNYHINKYTIDSSDENNPDIFFTRDLYSNIAEKNALKLETTTKHVTHPTLSKNNNNRKNTVKNIVLTKKDFDGEDLGSELKEIYKSQKRRVSRFTKRRQLHDLKTVDIYVDDIFRLATASNNQDETDNTWVLNKKNTPSINQLNKKQPTYTDCLSNVVKVPNKSQALIFSAKFSHNVKHYIFKFDVGSVRSKRPIFPDNGEFSVHSNIIARK